MVELTIKPFLNAQDIGEGQIVTLLEGAVNDELVRKGTGEKVKIIQFPIKLENGEERFWTLNSRSQGRIAEAYGWDPGAWHGKKVPIKTVVQDVYGEQKDVIYALPLKEWPEDLKDIAVREIMARSPAKVEDVKEE